MGWWRVQDLNVDRQLPPDAVVVLTFGNRCFPTEAVRGWLVTDEDGRVAIVRGHPGASRLTDQGARVGGTGASVGREPSR